MIKINLFLDNIKKLCTGKMHKRFFIIQNIKYPDDCCYIDYDFSSVNINDIILNYINPRLCFKYLVTDEVIIRLNCSLKFAFTEFVEEMNICTEYYSLLIFDDKKEFIDYKYDLKEKLINENKLLDSLLA